MVQAQLKAPAIDVSLVVPFMNAVRDVFRKMAGVEITVERPKLKESPGATYDVCGIIGFSGAVSGSVAVTFSDEAAVALVAAFAGSAMERSSPDFADAIGELANMIAGAAKQSLGGMASISIPSVVIGKGFSVANLSEARGIVIPCLCAFGRFTVEVAIKRNAMG